MAQRWAQALGPQRGSQLRLPLAVPGLWPRGLARLPRAAEALASSSPPRRASPCPREAGDGVCRVTAGARPCECGAESVPGEGCTQNKGPGPGRAAAVTEAQASDKGTGGSQAAPSLPH